MPKATTCQLKTHGISVETALRLRDQAKHERIPRPDFKCAKCGCSVKPHRESPFGAAHFEHLNRNPSCPFSTPDRQP